MNQIRAILRFAAFTLASVGIYSSWWVTSFFIPNKTYWRQLAFGLWSRAFIRIAGVRLDVIGEPPQPPFFLAANHLGYADIPILRAAASGVFVAKHDLADWFLAGRMMRDMGMVFINRGNRRDIPRAESQIIDRLSGGEGIIVFPEGTSTKGEEVLPFRSSFFEFAAKSDVPVSYAAISYRTPDGEGPASEFICWWDDTPFLKHMLRMFSLPGYEATVVFGTEPIVRTDRKELAGELHRRVERSFIPVI